MNEKLRKNEGGVLTKLFLYHLLIALVYQTDYQMNVTKQAFYSVVVCADYLINIFMNFDGNRS